MRLWDGRGDTREVEAAMTAAAVTPSEEPIFRSNGPAMADRIERGEHRR